MEDFMGYRDPKVASYPLMGSSKPTMVLSIFYLIFVLFLGPAWMKKRNPFTLRHPMLIYNMSLVVWSSWIVINVVIYGWSIFNWRCEPIDFSYSDKAKKMAQICWIFYLSKLVEYCDTIFFVLRKKDSQINFLHVFHHSTVPITTWYAISYGPGGYNMFFLTLNAFVHIWMYLYYGLAALGPGIQKYLWWKKYLTSLQLMQFVFVTGYFIQLNLFPKEGCLVLPFLTWISLGQAIVYLILFTNFYLKSYIQVPEKLNCNSRNNLDRLEGHNGNTYVDSKKVK